MRVASVEGLNGLSIGRLAADLDMSKSGLFAHFTSKEELQLAAIGAAHDLSIAEVVTPALVAPAGLRRLRVLCDRYLVYSAQRVFPGGCFFVHTTAEFDSQPGRVRDALAAEVSAWLRYLEGNARIAIERGELRAEVDPRALAFEINALLNAANSQSVLLDDDNGYAMARRGILERLRAAATDPTLLPESGAHDPLS
jgi:AcrR family transcriptional regulator